ncbi:MAG: isoaspartyl peptidase/L-asparaginase [Caldiserica bacterium]|jgi:beta-aspartyl-peptidase (threonine type)|nr:isoaspartyl peptidase/L-asparaginase [Caldisericota bacterium]MDH7562801.1 isoaspartyl peptidase/L-asparaginase [Caldisericota bacterium]
MAQLIIHGGAGKIREEEEHRKGIQEALKLGWEALLNQGPLEAVLAAVCSMEDNPVFNCGFGSSLNLEKEVEMDASVMLSDGSFGGVAALKAVRHPILVARKVMEETDHLLLSGDGALKFARKMGFEPFDPATEERLKILEEQIQSGNLPYLPRLSRALRENPSQVFEKWGTVGAVARDDTGVIAVATSTGGISGKLPGRVGDSPIPGAGTFASNFGGVSCTGHGEEILRLLLAFRACEGMQFKTAPQVLEELATWANSRGCSCGLIGIDWRGNIGFAFNTQSMSYGFTDGKRTVIF